MSNPENPSGKVLGNVGVLDLRDATEESVAAISLIGNVGMAIHTPETAHLIARINMGNLGSTLEVPAGAQFYHGQTRTNFKDVAEPINMVVNGQLFIEPETTAADVEAGLKKLQCAGQVYCPEPAVGALQAKMSDASGQLITYAPTAQITMGKLVLNDHTLSALEDGAHLLHLGQVDMLDIVDEEILAAKISRLQVQGRINCREENLAALSARLDQSLGAPSIATVPSGYLPVPAPITLDDTSLANLPGPRLYCEGLVIVDADTSAETLDTALEGLRGARLLIAPERLKGALASKCNLLDTKAIFYSGELWHIEEDSELLAGRFDYLDGQPTLVVHGELTIAADIAPGVLAERLAKIHNFETIACTPEQMPAVQARLGINEGELIDSTQEEEEAEARDGIGNAGHLKL